MSIQSLKLRLRDLLSTKAKRFYMKSILYQNRIRRYFTFRGKIKSILIVRLASIGDVIRANLIVDMLKKKYPDATIDFLTSKSTLDVIQFNRNLKNIYTLENLESVPDHYDWIVNLQAPEPPASFMKASGYSFKQFLEIISEPHRSGFITGRHYRKGREILPTVIYSCQSEIEEIAFIALFNFHPDMVSMPRYTMDPSFQPSSEIYQKLQTRNHSKPLIGIFIGSASQGDHDGGSRTYSISYLGRMVDEFYKDNYIVLFGQLSGKSDEDRREFEKLLTDYPDIINFVDKTDLKNLLWLISSMSLVISSDSGPVHMAIGSGVPLIALYSNCSLFRMSSKKTTDKYVLIDAFQPCFKYTMQWKFFCNGCEEWRSTLYNCNQKSVPVKLDTIPLTDIRMAANLLLNKNG